MTILGRREDGAWHISLGGGFALILKGEVSSPPVDPSVTAKYGPWTRHLVTADESLAVERQLARARVRPVSEFSLALIRRPTPPAQATATVQPVAEAHETIRRVDPAEHAAAPATPAAPAAAPAEGREAKAARHAHFKARQAQKAAGAKKRAAKRAGAAPAAATPKAAAPVSAKEQAQIKAGKAYTSPSGERLKPPSKESRDQSGKFA
jgi:hypothetical protein